MEEWVAKLGFHARLPPELQLTPYSAGDSPTAELRRRLHENASSSSSAASSPEPQRRARTQAEILQEHRHSQHSQPAQHAQPAQPAQRRSATPDRQIESSVLPSLPARQAGPAPGTPSGSEEVLLRAGEGAAWGRSRFSNGRDLNAEFIRSQKEASQAQAPPLPPTGPPDRPPAIPERAPIDRSGNPDRNSNQPEKSSVTALVNSYQQRMRQDGNGNRVQQQNNNWNTVETTSHFYSASELAYGGGSAGGTRPASVAGSGGSPALDQRPASRSSGESELSVSGVSKEKKEKKGVFGGLFRKKPRPQSHM